ncbi:MAG: metal ABC transporter permease [Sedimentisphaerales bacterium]|nr:metal ABC transporter permease [Sedimentisphaerales bacterium]
MDPFFYLVIAGGAIAGSSTGLLGVYIVGTRMPFIGVCISHAAMVGSIVGVLAGFNPVIGAVAVSIVTAMSLAAIGPSNPRLDINVGLSILFSLMLGLTFLGIGLVQDSRTELFALLWGSLLFVRKETVLLMALLGLALAVFAILFNKEMKVILFSRSLAAATGVHQGFVYCLFLALCGVTLAVNLNAIGGLMIFSLITNPAAAAYQVCRGHRSVVIVSTFLGALSAMGGFLLSFYLNLPTGACIVLFSTFLFGLAAGFRFLTGNKD